MSIIQNPPGASWEKKIAMSKSESTVYNPCTPWFPKAIYNIWKLILFLWKNVLTEFYDFSPHVFGWVFGDAIALQIPPSSIGFQLAHVCLKFGHFVFFLFKTSIDILHFLVCALFQCMQNSVFSQSLLFSMCFSTVFLELLLTNFSIEWTLLIYELGEITDDNVVMWIHAASHTEPFFATGDL